MQQQNSPLDVATNDWFGVSVSVSGDYAVVGARGDNSDAGSAYIRSLWDDLDATTKTHRLDGLR